MKKIIFIVIVIIVAIFMYINVNASSYDIVIPDAAIRVRVIANSNSIYDQSMKMKVKDYIEKSISVSLVDVDNIDSARDIISNSIRDLDFNIKKLFDDENYHMDYSIHYGDNYFPSKDFRGVHYEEGKYESLVVTIGEGEGDNWWCVLFPPLCLLEADESNTSDVEYKFFVQKLIQKIFS